MRGPCLWAIIYVSRKYSSTYIHSFKASFSYSLHFNIASPLSEKLHSDSALWVGANEILSIFQRSVFSPRVPPAILLLFNLFFVSLILNAEIKEASKSRGGAEVEVTRRTVPILQRLGPPRFSQHLTKMLEVGTPHHPPMRLQKINKILQNSEGVWCISLQLMKPPIDWDKL